MQSPINKKDVPVSSSKQPAIIPFMRQRSPLPKDVHRTATAPLGLMAMAEKLQRKNKTSPASSSSASSPVLKMNCQKCKDTEINLNDLEQQVINLQRENGNLKKSIMEQQTSEDKNKNTIAAKDQEISFFKQQFNQLLASIHGFNESVASVVSKGLPASGSFKHPSSIDPASLAGSVAAPAGSPFSAGLRSQQDDSTMMSCCDSQCSCDVYDHDNTMTRDGFLREFAVGSIPQPTTSATTSNSSSSSLSVSCDKNKSLITSPSSLYSLSSYVRSSAEKKTDSEQSWGFGLDSDVKQTESNDFKPVRKDLLEDIDQIRPQDSAKDSDVTVKKLDQSVISDNLVKSVDTREGESMRIVSVTLRSENNASAASIEDREIDKQDKEKVIKCDKNSNDVELKPSKENAVDRSSGKKRRRSSEGKNKMVDTELNIDESKGVSIIKKKRRVQLHTVSLPVPDDVSRGKPIDELAKEKLVCAKNWIKDGGSLRKWRRWCSGLDDDCVEEGENLDDTIEDKEKLGEEGGEERSSFVECEEKSVVKGEEKNSVVESEDKSSVQEIEGKSNVMESDERSSITESNEKCIVGSEGKTSTFESKGVGSTVEKELKCSKMDTKENNSTMENEVKSITMESKVQSSAMESERKPSTTGSEVKSRAMESEEKTSTTESKVKSSAMESEEKSNQVEREEASRTKEIEGNSTIERKGIISPTVSPTDGIVEQNEMEETEICSESKSKKKERRDSKEGENERRRRRSRDKRRSSSSKSVQKDTVEAKERERRDSVDKATPIVVHNLQQKGVTKLECENIDKDNANKKQKDNENEKGTTEEKEIKDKHEEIEHKEKDEEKRDKESEGKIKEKGKREKNAVERNKHIVKDSSDSEEGFTDDASFRRSSRIKSKSIEATIKRKKLNEKLHVKGRVSLTSDESSSDESSAEESEEAMCKVVILDDPASGFLSSCVERDRKLARTVGTSSTPKGKMLRSKSRGEKVKDKDSEVDKHKMAEKGLEGKIDVDRKMNQEGNKQEDKKGKESVKEESGNKQEDKKGKKTVKEKSENIMEDKKDKEKEMLSRGKSSNKIKDRAPNKTESVKGKSHDVQGEVEFKCTAKENAIKTDTGRTSVCVKESETETESQSALERLEKEALKNSKREEKKDGKKSHDEQKKKQRKEDVRKEVSSKISEEKTNSAGTGKLKMKENDRNVLGNKKDCTSKESATKEQTKILQVVLKDVKDQLSSKKIEKYRDNKEIKESGGKSRVEVGKKRETKRSKADGTSKSSNDKSTDKNRLIAYRKLAEKASEIQAVEKKAAKKIRDRLIEERGEVTFIEEKEKPKPKWKTKLSDSESETEIETSPGIAMINNVFVRRQIMKSEKHGLLKEAILKGEKAEREKEMKKRLAGTADSEKNESELVIADESETGKMACEKVASEKVASESKSLEKSTENERQASVKRTESEKQSLDNGNDGMTLHSSHNVGNVQSVQSMTSTKQGETNNVPRYYTKKPPPPATVEEISQEKLKFTKSLNLKVSPMKLSPQQNVLSKPGHVFNFSKRISKSSELIQTLPSQTTNAEDVLKLLNTSSLLPTAQPYSQQGTADHVMNLLSKVQAPKDAPQTTASDVMSLIKSSTRKESQIIKPTAALHSTACQDVTNGGKRQIPSLLDMKIEKPPARKDPTQQLQQPSTAQVMKALPALQLIPINQPSPEKEKVRAPVYLPKDPRRRKVSQDSTTKASRVLVRSGSPRVSESQKRTVSAKEVLKKSAQKKVVVPVLQELPPLMSAVDLFQPKGKDKEQGSASTDVGSLSASARSTSATTSAPQPSAAAVGSTSTSSRSSSAKSTPVSTDSGSPSAAAGQRSISAVYRLQRSPSSDNTATGDMSKQIQPLTPPGTDPQADAESLASNSPHWVIDTDSEVEASSPVPTDSNWRTPKLWRTDSTTPPSSTATVTSPLMTHTHPVHAAAGVAALLSQPKQIPLSPISTTGTTAARGASPHLPPPRRLLVDTHAAASAARRSPTEWSTITETQCLNPKAAAAVDCAVLSSQGTCKPPVTDMEGDSASQGFDTNVKGHASEVTTEDELCCVIVKSPQDLETDATTVSESNTDSTDATSAIQAKAGESAILSDSKAGDTTTILAAKAEESSSDSDVIMMLGDSEPCNVPSNMNSSPDIDGQKESMDLSNTNHNEISMSSTGNEDSLWESAVTLGNKQEVVVNIDESSNLYEFAIEWKNPAVEERSVDVEQKKTEDPVIVLDSDTSQSDKVLQDRNSSEVVIVDDGPMGVKDAKRKSRQNLKRSTENRKRNGKGSESLRSEDRAESEKSKERGKRGDRRDRGNKATNEKIERETSRSREERRGGRNDRSENESDRGLRRSQRNVRKDDDIKETDCDTVKSRRSRRSIKDRLGEKSVEVDQSTRRRNERVSDLNRSRSDERSERVKDDGVRKGRHEREESRDNPNRSKRIERSEDISLSGETDQSTDSPKEGQSSVRRSKRVESKKREQSRSTERMQEENTPRKCLDSEHSENIKDVLGESTKDSEKSEEVIQRSNKQIENSTDNREREKSQDAKQQAPKSKKGKVQGKDEGKKQGVTGKGTEELNIVVRSEEKKIEDEETGNKEKRKEYDEGKKNEETRRDGNVQKKKDGASMGEIIEENRTEKKPDTERNVEDVTKGSVENEKARKDTKGEGNDEALENKSYKNKADAKIENKQRVEEIVDKESDVKGGVKEGKEQVERMRSDAKCPVLGLERTPEIGMEQGQKDKKNATITDVIDCPKDTQEEYMEAENADESASTKEKKSESDTVKEKKSESDAVKEKKSESDAVKEKKSESDTVKEMKSESDTVKEKKSESDAVKEKKSESDAVKEKKSESDTVKEKKSESDAVKEKKSESDTVKEKKSESDTVKEKKSESDAVKEKKSESDTVKEKKSESDTVKQKKSESDTVKEKKSESDAVKEKKSESDTVKERKSESDAVKEKQQKDGKLVEQIDVETGNVMLKEGAVLNKKGQEHSEVQMNVEISEVKGKTDDESGVSESGSSSEESSDDSDSESSDSEESESKSSSEDESSEDDDSSSSSDSETSSDEDEEITENATETKAQVITQENESKASATEKKKESAKSSKDLLNEALSRKKQKETETSKDAEKKTVGKCSTSNSGIEVIENVNNNVMDKSAGTQNQNAANGKDSEKEKDESSDEDDSEDSSSSENETNTEVKVIVSEKVKGSESSSPEETKATANERKLEKQTESSSDESESSSENESESSSEDESGSSSAEESETEGNNNKETKKVDDKSKQKTDPESMVEYQKTNETRKRSIESACIIDTSRTQTSDEVQHLVQTEDDNSQSDKVTVKTTLFKTPTKAGPRSSFHTDSPATKRIRATPDKYKSPLKSFKALLSPAKLEATNYSPNTIARLKQLASQSKASMDSCPGNQDGNQEKAVVVECEVVNRQLIESPRKLFKFPSVEADNDNSSQNTGDSEVAELMTGKVSRKRITAKLQLDFHGDTAEASSEELDSSGESDTESSNEPEKENDKETEKLMESESSDDSTDTESSDEESEEEKKKEDKCEETNEKVECQKGKEKSRKESKEKTEKGGKISKCVMQEVFGHITSSEDEDMNEKDDQQDAKEMSKEESFPSLVLEDTEDGEIKEDKEEMEENFDMSAIFGYDNSNSFLDSPSAFDKPKYESTVTKGKAKKKAKKSKNHEPVTGKRNSLDKKRDSLELKRKSLELKKNVEKGEAERREDEAPKEKEKNWGTIEQIKEKRRSGGNKQLEARSKHEAQRVIAGSSKKDSRGNEKKEGGSLRRDLIKPSLTRLRKDEGLKRNRKRGSFESREENLMARLRREKLERDRQQRFGNGLESRRGKDLSKGQDELRHLSEQRRLGRDRERIKGVDIKGKRDTDRKSSTPHRKGDSEQADRIERVAEREDAERERRKVENARRNKRDRSHSDERITHGRHKKNKLR